MWGIRASDDSSAIERTVQGRYLSARTDRRGRLRRADGGAGAGGSAGAGDGGGPAESPPVSAAALPGSDGGTLSGRDRQADPPDSALATQCPRAVGGGAVGRCDG